MIERIENNNIHWHCQAREFPDDPPCGILNMASLDEVSYQEAEGSVFGQGAVIVLPACLCGAQTSLKADYTVKELYRTVMKYEESGMYAAVLPLRYVHNLLIHWMLYQRGKATYAPVLDMPPQAVLDHLSFASIKPGTVYALWFGFSAVRQASLVPLIRHHEPNHAIEVQSDAEKHNDGKYGEDSITNKFSRHTQSFQRDIDTTNEVTCEHRTTNRWLLYL